MRYHNITKDDMLNGSGLRVVLWVAGCEHHCEHCQNPITWDIEGGLEFDAAAKQEIFDELEKDYVSGITFSGGDPLHTRNRFEVGKLISEIRRQYPTKTIWVYTGYSFQDLLDLPYLDQIDVLVDGKFVEAMKDDQLHWCGSSNQRVIDVKKTIEMHQIVIASE